MLYGYYFFSKQNTANGLHISDWSSDVCCSDLLKLLYDWIPFEFTESGAPKVDETTLGSLDHIPAAKLLVEYLTVDKRLGQLADGDQAWLKVVRANRRIHGRVNTLGAITRRMTHSTPNEIGRASCRARVCTYVEIPVVAEL